MDYRAQLRQYVVDALTTANTLAGANVFTPRTWATNDSVYPSLLVQTPRERKESRAKGNQLPQFNATLMVSVGGRLRSLGADSTAAAAVEEQLDQFASQIECAVLCYQPILQSIKQVAFVDMEMDVSSSGREHIGQVQFNFGFEFQVDFDPVVDAPAAWPPLTSPLTTVDVTYDQPNGTTEPGLTILLPQ